MGASGSPHGPMNPGTHEPPSAILRAMLTRYFGSRRLALAILLVFVTAARSAGQGLPAAPPESLGLSQERLDRLSKAMQGYIDGQRAAGIVTIVVRQGKVAQLAAYGRRDIEADAPMKTDTIFRIASMSKAITSVGIMMLMEEGKLLLKDPVSKYIPAFKKTTVMVPPPAGAVPGSPVSVVPAKREITIRDLLTHTAGISYGNGPAEAQYKA